MNLTTCLIVILSKHPIIFKRQVALASGTSFLVIVVVILTNFNFCKGGEGKISTLRLY